MTTEEEKERIQREKREKEVQDICTSLFGPFDEIQESFLSMKFGQIPPKYHPHPRTIAKVRNMKEWPTSIQGLETLYAYCHMCAKKAHIHTTCRLSIKALTGSCDGMVDEAAKEHIIRQKREKEQEVDD